MFLATEFDWHNLVSFLLGVLTGIILLLSVILLMITKEKRVQKKKIIGSTINDLTKEKVKELIINKQEAFLFEVEENDKDYIKTTSALVLELLHEIASYYYPDSKYPEYELTVDEAAQLIHYIVDQILALFDKPVLKRIKTVKVSTIVSKVEEGKKISNSKLLKAAKDSKESLSVYKAAVNVINPVYWLKKSGSGMLNIAIKRLCKSAIAITGKEANKVYSKNLFKNDEDLKDLVEKSNDEITEIFSDEE